MRHRVAHRKLGRVTEHRIAMLRNQATALRYEHMRRRCRKRKSCGRRSGSSPRWRSVSNGRRAGEGAPNEHRQALNARRPVMHDLQDRDVVAAVRHARATVPVAAWRLHRLWSGTRMIWRKSRRWSVGSESNQSEGRGRSQGQDRASRKRQEESVGGRLRAAAERFRGKKDDDTTEEKAPKRTSAKGAGGAKPRPKKQGPREEEEGPRRPCAARGFSLWGSQRPG
jgi:hypothetical protein